MKVDTYIADVQVYYVKPHPLFPDILLGENVRFDVQTNDGKVIAGIVSSEKKRFGVGESSHAKVVIKWFGGIENEFKNETKIPVIVLNENIGYCEVFNFEVKAGGQASFS